jgi:release factor glutamine methyltransferase
VTAAALELGASVAAARRALANAFREADLDSPELDARLLIGHALGLEHAALVSAAERPLSATDRQRILALAARRLKHEPIAHLLGRKGFWDVELQVSADVLVPRPETETLIEAAIEIFAARRLEPLRVADLGTGSGAIILSLLREFPHAMGHATDCSAPALAMARDNARRHGMAHRAEFVLGDYGTALAGGFDLVVSNPPYIPSADIGQLAPDVRDYDPRLALDGGADGLDAYRAIAADARRLVRPGGFLILEIGIGQAEMVTALLTEAGMAAMLPPRPDLAGIPRAVVASYALTSV